MSETKLVCIQCGREYSEREPVWRCACGGLLDLLFTPGFGYGRIEQRAWTLWRYRESLPIAQDRNLVTLGEGCTPLTESRVDGHRVLFKQDQLFPTGSYKDRGAAVLISHCKELGIAEVVEDSSGNAGCAIAAYCARAGIGCRIFVPETTAAAKLAQIRSYGAEVILVPGTREDTARAAFEAAQTTYYASHSWNPYFFHGTKTVAYEICEQLGWHAPDSVVVPAGNGTLLLGAWIGFSELREMGIIRHVPKLIAVQAAACAPLAALVNGTASEAGITIAEGIAIAEPVRLKQMAEVIQQVQGQVIAVDEAEIQAALEESFAQGFYIEPTSAAAVAGLKRYLPSAVRDETVVCVLTGHGLKKKT